MTDEVDESTDITTEAAVVSEMTSDRAFLLVGDAKEQWEFPIEMLPAHVEVGSYLLVEMDRGRPVNVELNRDEEAVARKGLDARLARLARYEQLTGHEVRIS